MSALGNGISEGHSVRVEDLTAYLARRGWKRVDHANDRLLMFLGPADDAGVPLRVVVPRRNDFEDTWSLIARAVDLLSILENRSFAETIQSIRALDKDVLRLRVLNGPSQSGSLSFELATKLVQGLRNLLSYAACTEEDPRPYFAKATSIGRAYVERCRFGQTFSGSFGFTIESPISLTAHNQIDALKEPAAPFERRVMARLVRGLAFTQEALLSGDVLPLTNNYATALNANMCEAILEMPKEIRETEVEYSVIWSSELKAPTDILRVAPIRLEPKTYDYIEAAARSLRKVEQSVETRVRGRTIQLRSEAVPSDDEEDENSGEHMVTILRDEQDGQPIRIRVSLDPTSYKAACDAHKDGRMVSIEGKLEKLGKFWSLMSPHDFRIE